jgi:hypothetical protein
VLVDQVLALRARVPERARAVSALELAPAQAASVRALESELARAPAA